MKKILAISLLLISSPVSAELTMEQLCYTIQATKQAHVKIIGDFIDHQNSAYFHGRIALLMELKELLECHRFIKIKSKSKSKSKSKNKPTTNSQDGIPGW